MHQVDDAPMETLHIFYEREQPPQPSLLPIVLSVLALSAVIAFGVLSPPRPPVARDELRVPAVPLALKTFTAQVAIIPSGVKVYPATTAHGTLTITNGSVIAQTLPADFILMSKNGVQVSTDYAVYVPGGSANGYGYATVSAHALIPGAGGNVATLAINQVIGSSVYIRNLSAFTSGHDGYSVRYATAEDKQAALLHARDMLLNKSSGLHYPCTENHFAGTHLVMLAWRCQFVQYHVPAYYHVTSVRLLGKNLLLDVWFIPRPLRMWVK
jgi:hypothetical protein